MRLSLRALPLVAALSVAALLPSPSQAATTVQPGAYMQSAGAGCTMGFLFSGPGGKTYIGSAAHCVTSVGDDVADIDGVVWGKVSFIGNADVTNTDYSFIEVLPAALSRVSAAVKGYPAYPTGYVTNGEASTGDEIQISGYGLGFDLTQPTQEWRTGFYTGGDAEFWMLAGPMINGDSGGPLVHIPTGKALGFESRLCLGVCTDEGPTVEGVLAKAAAAGFPVSLLTV